MSCGVGVSPAIMPVRSVLWRGRLACASWVDPEGLRDHHRAMRRLVPISVLLLVAGWLAATALDLPVMAAVVAVSCIGAACAGAVCGRAPDLRLAAALTAILIALLAALLFLPGGKTGGATGLCLQLAFMALLAPLVPIIYALTFPADRDVR